jgi:hypothetical protein
VPGELVQFAIQFTLSAGAITLPGLLAFNVGRPSRVPVLWQIVLLLALAAWLAWAPWNGVDR